MKAKVVTLGCKVNAYESEFIKEQLLDNGYELVDEEADVIVINTCSVTNQADAKSRKLIRREKRENKAAIVIACGCMCENHQTDLTDLGIDILIGNKDKSKLIEYLNEYKKNHTQISKFYDLKSVAFEDMMLKNYKSLTRAYVKIEDGCNNYCSYCTIPYVRGSERSKDFNTCIKEITDLVNSGHKEIVLTGIHTGNYKWEDKRLVDLIREISKLQGLERIRISSIEITELDNDFLSELKINSKICNHLHIPLQSGSETTLKDMHRKYNPNEFLNIINKIRSVRPDISITTDVIVGFPTETEENFNETYNFIKTVNFSKIHVFPYSKRDNTVAAKLKNIASDEAKKTREHKLLELSSELENNYANKFIGCIVDVLTERNNEGHTSNYLNVLINQDVEDNKIYQVKILDISDNKVIGKLV